MGDFLLALGTADDRALGQSAEFLRFYPDMRVDRFAYPEFSLLITSADNPQLWAPFASPDNSLLVALCGRVALDQKQWESAAQIAGQGGLACKSISQRYSASGIAGLETLSGNFVIALFDRPARKLFLVTDRWGLLPAFRCDAGGRLLYGSHPDALADLAGESRNWDLTSFAEFILTGKLSAPFTYYQKIKALPVASTTTLSLNLGAPVTGRRFPLSPSEGERAGVRGPSWSWRSGAQSASNGPGVLSLQPNPLVAEQTRTYFHFQSQPQPPEKTEEVAEQFAAAFRQAVAKRTLPLLGKSAIALSGGLDSRTVLCAAPDRQALLTFSCYDQENLEFRIARSVAQAAGVEFIPLKRPFDYYGDHAALGVRISAGMGCIASNHFLGFRPRLRELGIQNLLTGCYCDYLFKGLALNKRVNPWTTRERLNGFDFSYYFGHFHSSTALGAQVRQRLEDIFPAELRRYDTEAVIQTVEQRRMFPLAYEEDNAERTIPQRVMGWYVPIADNDLMDVIQNMSCAMKLNRSLFAKTVGRICGDAISNIPDANTGVPVHASLLREASSAHLRRAGQLLEKLRPSNATGGSWLNWGYYARHSKVVQSLWASPSPDALDVFRQVLGHDGFSPDPAAYDGRRLWLFMQLFTLKLWFDQRSR
jgi:asparagine synthase (glutamine-hydrolysing)